MSVPSDGLSRIESANITVEELLLLIGDKDKGAKSEAMDVILSKGFDAVYPTLEKAVRDDHNANLRNGAMETLVSFGKQGLPNLIKLLEDENEEVRNFSAVMLGDIGNREAVSALIQSLRDHDINVRHGAAEALGKIGDRTAFTPLMELLKEDFWLQYPAIVALGEMRDKRAVPQLLELLDNELLVVPVIEALGKIGDKRALGTLCSILGFSDDKSLSGALAKAIVTICTEWKLLHHHQENQNDFDCNSRLQNVLQDKGILKLKEIVRQGDDKETVSATITLLGWLKETTALPDFFNLLECDHYLETIEEAIFTMGKEAIPYLVESLSLPYENVRIVAARLIGQLGDDTSASKLIPLLHGTGEHVQEECLEALRGTVDDGILPVLFEMVEFGSDEISVRASEVLSSFPFSSFRQFLQNLLASPDPLKRSRAAVLLGYVNDESSPAMLCLLAKDENVSVRKQLIKALGRKKSPDSIPVLVRSLNEVDEDLKIEAVKSSAEYGKHAPLTEILGLLDTSSEKLVCTIIETLGNIGSDCAGRALLEYLRGRTLSPCIEFLVVETLGKINYKPALGTLIMYLKHHDPDFRRLAVIGLGSIASPDSWNDVRSACRDSHWSVRVAALHTLWKIDSAIAVPTIIEALSDNDYMVRQNAVTALEETTPALAIPLLVEQLSDEEIGTFASRSLLKFGRKGLTLLHRLMKKEYPIDTRERVIDIVGRIGSTSSVKPLMEMLDDPGHSIRLAAIDALVFCFDVQPLKKLSHLMRSDECVEVRERAKFALKTLTMEKFL